MFVAGRGLLGHSRGSGEGQTCLLELPKVVVSELSIHPVDTLLVVPNGEPFGLGWKLLGDVAGPLRHGPPAVRADRSSFGSFMEITFPSRCHCASPMYSSLRMRGAQPRCMGTIGIVLADDEGSRIHSRQSGQLANMNTSNALPCWDGDPSRPTQTRGKK